MIHEIFDVTLCHRVDAPAEKIMAAMRKSAHLLGCTIRAELVEPFQPHGATCVLVLAESHLTVTTWPEHRLAHIDVFTCRADSNPGHAINPILDLLGGHVAHTQTVPRLAPGEPGRHSDRHRLGPVSEVHTVAAVDPTTTRLGSQVNGHVRSDQR